MQFKTLALATTSLVAFGLTVAPASAATAMMGDLNLGYTYNWENFDDGGESWDQNYAAVFGNGRVNLPYSDTINLQLDAVGRASLDSVFGSKASHLALGGHINYRDNQGSLGVFAGVGRLEDAFLLSAPIFTAGFEGQYFCDQWTLRGQLAYMDSDESWYILKSAGVIRVGGNYYASKKLKLTADLAYIAGESGDSDYDVEEWGWALGAHYWFGQSMPVSGFIEYRGRSATTDLGGGSEGTDDQNSLNLGVMFHFGGDGFQDADRNGASQDLPDLDWYRLYPASVP